MTAPPKFRLAMPPSPSREGLPNAIEHEGVVVVIGANGSGKSRLGAWLELTSEHKNAAHRVSAQKSLTLPASVSPKSVTEAAEELIFGYREAGGNVGYKHGHRWGSNPITSLLNDYERLVVYLFSEDYDASITFRQRARESDQRIEPPVTKLDVAKAIWERTIPHRELVIGGGKIETRVRGSVTKQYSASEMSDGERVVLYLIGECLAAPAHSTIIIDEPELHLHKSIQSKLWSEIEAERTDCQFVYLTHDVDFAASRTAAPKVWVKSFDGSSWDWDLIPEAEGIPEELLLEVIGSRKPVLFVEGEKDSLDASIYTHVYAQYSVVPVGSSTHVIHNTAALQALETLHNLSCRGMIDRDYRTNEQTDYLKERGVYSLAVAELENVLLTESVLLVIAASLAIDDPAGLIAEAKQVVMEELRRDRETVISRIVTSRIEGAWTTFDANARGEAEISTAVAAVVGSINVTDLYAEAKKLVDSILATNDYPAALRVYQNKGLIFRVARLFGFDGRNYREFVQRLLKSNESLVAAVRSELPTLDT